MTDDEHVNAYAGIDVSKRLTKTKTVKSNKTNEIISFTLPSLFPMWLNKWLEYKCVCVCVYFCFAKFSKHTANWNISHKMLSNHQIARYLCGINVELINTIYRTYTTSCFNKHNLLTERAREREATLRVRVCEYLCLLAQKNEKQNEKQKHK